MKSFAYFYSLNKMWRRTENEVIKKGKEERKGERRRNEERGRGTKVKGKVMRKRRGRKGIESGMRWIARKEEKRREKE
jgi:hypothetical protein